MKQSTSQQRWWGPFFVALGSSLWGIETIFRVNLQKYFESDILVFFEHLLAVLLLTPLFLKNLKGFLRLDLGNLFWLFISGFIGSAVGTIFFTSSLSHLNLSVANVLLNLQPVVSVVLARLFLGEKVAKGFGGWALVAVLAGIAISIDHFDSGAFHLQSLKGLLLVGGTILSWGAATVAGRGLMVKVPLGVAVPARFFVGSIGCLAVLWYNNHVELAKSQMHLMSNHVVIKEYLWLLLVAGLTPLFFYFYGLKHTSATAGAFCEMSQTIAALAVTWIVMGQALLLHQIIASLFLAIAVTRVNWLQAKRGALPEFYVG